jgi:transposase
MKKLPDLKQLSDEAKNALIVELWQEIQKLRAALDTDESKPNSSPAKTSSNSSTPPSKGFKRNIKPKPSKTEGVKRQNSVGRASGGRHLHPNPDQIIIAQIKSCPQCSETVSVAAQKLQSVYDKIELPPIRPIVTRIERYGGRCACCQTEYLAPVPAGMEPGSPFGSSIQSLVTYLRYTHAIGYERLSGILSSVFGLKISEGAIANLLSTVKTSLDDLCKSNITTFAKGKINLLG